jgi:hypothetical protein
MDYTFKDFIRCLSTWTGTLDRRRLTYLAFLTQYDIYNLGIVNIAIEYTHGNKPITKSKFFIGYDNIVELEDLLYTEDIDLFGSYSMPHSIEERIIDVIHKHSKKKTWQLATTIKKKLRLTPEEKRRDYLGVNIDAYLHAEKFKLIKKEI